jgi:2-polyprenyl-3-methyl-5-hydroxy-6-metoxy-1,4-benzoquinol methylase
VTSAPNTATSLGATPTVAQLREVFRREYPFFRDVVDRGMRTFGPSWLQEFEETLSRLFEGEDALARAGKSYALFVMDLLRRQQRFERDHRYPEKSYEETAREVYLDEGYMLSEYLPGLLVSHFLWPHHCWHYRFFDAAFVSQMLLRPEPRFAEVGVGTGLYSRRVLQQVLSAQGTGIDISPASQAFAERHIQAFGFQDRYRTELRNIITDPSRPTEWVISIEVLEHLEDPLGFLRALRAMLAPGGHAFITAALNAAHVDHIYLYESSDQVIAQLEAAGFALEQAFLGAAYAPAAPNTPVPAVAAFVVG